MHTNVKLGDIQKKVKRLNNPYLNQLGYTWEGKKPLENYNGVNTSLEETNKNSGDVLRIRKLVKVGKDGSGTYLYWGYIYNTSEENDPEIKDLDKYAVPVCFESYKRLEDIAKDNDEDEVRAFLDFMSRTSNFEKTNTVKYIGYIYKKTIETETEIIDQFMEYSGEESESSAIRARIKEIQSDYLYKKNNPDNSGNNGNNHDEAR